MAHPHTSLKAWNCRKCYQANVNSVCIRCGSEGSSSDCKIRTKPASVILMPSNAKSTEYLFRSINQMK